MIRANESEEGRVHQLIVELLPRWGLSHTEITLETLRVGDNFVYLLQILGAQKKRIFRASSKNTPSNIEFELALMSLLSSSIRVIPSVILTLDGYKYIATPDYHIVAFEFVEGFHPKINEGVGTQSRTLLDLGGLLACLGNFKEQELSQLPAPSRTLSQELNRALAMSDEISTKINGGAEFIGIARQYVAQLSERNSDGLVHNDIRPHNVLINDEGLITGLLDFDWSCRGNPFKDLSHTLIEWSFPDGASTMSLEIANQIYRGYVSAGGEPIQPEVLRWWMCFASLSDAATFYCWRIMIGRPPSSIKSSFMYAKFEYALKMEDVHVQAILRN